MARDYLIKDIAFQAGLSTATVDRVLNGRGGVRRQTMQRIEAAIDELRQQEQSAGTGGRTYVFDIIMETPDRFSTAVRTAFESQAAAFLPAIIRSRFHVAEQVREPEMVQLLAKVRLRGSHGVVLKAADTPAINAAVDQLHDAGIPVVTLVTDLPRSRRVGYAGADNRAAGETAAYLVSQRLAQGSVLVTLSSNRFRGEEEREIAFRQWLQARSPRLVICEISEGFGKDRPTYEQVRAALAADPSIHAVYSIGGGNRAIVEAFADAGRALDCFVAHDLDRDNRDLLGREKLHYVLHHDLGTDAAGVFRIFLTKPRAEPRFAGPALSVLSIITPFNMPA